MLFTAFMRVNVPCCMYFRKIADVSIFLHYFFYLILKRDSISFIMPIFMFLSQFLEILQGGGRELSQHFPGHNYTLNTPAQIGLTAVIKNGRLLTAM